MKLEFYWVNSQLMAWDPVTKVAIVYLPNTRRWHYSKPLTIDRRRYRDNSYVPVPRNRVRSDMWLAMPLDERKYASALAAFRSQPQSQQFTTDQLRLPEPSHLERDETYSAAA